MTVKFGMVFVRVDFLTFDGNGFPPAYGRCYGEAIILDEVMRHEWCSGLPAWRHNLLKVNWRIRSEIQQNMTRCREAQSFIIAILPTRCAKMGRYALYGLDA